MIRIVNDYGRPFARLDWLRIGNPCEGSYTVTTMTGVPIYGRHVPGSAHQVWMLGGWYACCERD